LTPNQDSINVINRDYSAQAVFTKYVEKVKAVVGK
jgi:hypothetical protein